MNVDHASIWTLTCHQSLRLLRTSSCTATSTLPKIPWFRELLVIFRNPKAVGRKPQRKQFRRRNSTVALTRAIGAQVGKVCWRPSDCSCEIFRRCVRETSPLLKSGVAPICVCVCMCVCMRVWCGTHSAGKRAHSSRSLSLPSQVQLVSSPSSGTHSNNPPTPLSIKKTATKTPRISKQQDLWDF